MLWNLYNSDYDRAGSYFGAQKANEGLHALFAIDTNRVAVDNLTGKTQQGLSVEAKVYGLDGTLLDDKVSGNLSLSSQGVQNDVSLRRRPPSRRSRRRPISSSSCCARTIA